MPSKKTILSSLFWKFLERGGTQGTQFVVSIVLARLLSPADFGLIALITVFITLANVFVQSGFNTALIQKKNADSLDFSSVFFASLGVAIVLYVVMFFAAPFIADFYERSELIPVIRVLSITLIIGALNSIQEAFVARNMLFKKLFVRSIGAVIPAGCLGIVLAYMGFGVWALVAQQLFNAFLMCVLMWLTVKWRPRLEFSLERVKSLFSYGWKLLVSALLDVGYNNLQSLVIGKLFAPATLGFYSRGNHFPNIVITNINSSIQSVMLPSFSAEQDNRVRLKQMVRRSIVVSSFVIVPMMAGLAALAKPLVLVLLGEKWLPCVPFIQIYCFIYSFWPIHTSNLSAINAVGRSDIFLKLEIIKKTLGISVLILFVYFFRTPIGIACTGAATCIISCFINANPNKKLLDYGYFEQMRDVIPSYLLSGGMCAGLLYLTTLAFNPFLQLVLYTVVGILFYVGVAKLLHFECLDYLIKTIRGLKNGK